MPSRMSDFEDDFEDDDDERIVSLPAAVVDDDDDFDDTAAGTQCSIWACGTEHAALRLHASPPTRKTSPSTPLHQPSRC